MGNSTHGQFRMRADAGESSGLQSAHQVPPSASDRGVGRRGFLAAAASGVAGLGATGWLPRVTADEARLNSKSVQFQPDMEPLVRMLEDTERSEVLARVGERIRQGTSYREVLGALLLAGIRNVQPRPSVGFKFHAVLVVNSAHLASLASPDHERWLPIFWAIDNFKSSQARDVQEGNWTMAPVQESRVPPAHRARQAFREALEAWDVEAADAATAGLVRAGGATEIFNLFSRYGARDFRSIGHKAIFVANSWRTLQVIGWRHAEPILRSLTYALLNHQGEPNPAKSDLDADRPYRRNLELVATLNPLWASGELRASATEAMQEALREGSAEETSRLAVKLLNDGAAPQSLLDAYLAGSVELLMRQPGIVGLHAVTTTNALHYAFRTCGDETTRQLILLQNAAFLPMFREAMRRRGKVRTRALDQIGEGIEKAPALDEIFHDVRADNDRAAAGALAFLNEHGATGAQQFVRTARQLIFQKGRDSHDYKFSSAVLEDYYHLSPSLQNQFLAASVYNLRGSQDADSGLLERTRQALSSA